MPTSTSPSQRLPLPADLRSAVALTLLTAVVLPAHAELNDTIHPYVLASINHDDNLLRVDNNIGGDLGDTFKTTEAGLVLERPIGRQVLTARASVSKVSFDRYDELDYNGKNVQAQLEWHLGNHLNGHVGGNYSQTLAPFADFHTNERNLRVSKREFADGTWQFHPSWQVHSGWSRDTYTYDLASQRYNNRHEDAAEVGFDFLSGTTSHFGLVARRLKGTYTDRQGFSAFFLDDAYQQDELKANVFWYISGSSQLQFLGGTARRKYPTVTERNESGVNGRAVYYWSPTVKVKTTSKLWREFQAVEGSLINSALTRGASIDASYELTAKISATASARSEKRTFRALPGATTRGGLDDTTQSYALGVNYAILPNIVLALNATHDRRNGSIGAGTNSFKANGVSFNVSAQF